MRELSVIVHLDLPGGEWPSDAEIAAEVSEVLDNAGFVVAESEPCPPMHRVRVIRDEVAGDG